MKKVALFILLIVTGLGIYFVLKPAQEPPSSLDPSQANLLPDAIPHMVDQKTNDVLEKVVPSSLKKSKAYEAFVDVNFKAPFYLREAELTAEEGREFVEKTFDSLKECYKEGCGQGPDEEGFYDPANTVAMVSMKRILEVALLDPTVLETQEWLEKEDLYELLDAANSQVRKLALQNLMSLHKNEPGVFGEVLKRSENLKGYSAADTIEQLIAYVGDQNKAEMVDTLAQIAKVQDGFTVTEVLERAEKMQVKPEDLETIGSELCRFSKTKADQRNFKAMNYTIGNMAKKSGTSFNLATYCR